MKRILLPACVCASVAAVFATSGVAGVEESADLGVTLSADQSAYAVGDLVTYTAAVTHLAGAAAGNVRVNDILPAGLELVSAVASQGSCTATTVGDDTGIETKAALAGFGEAAEVNLGVASASDDGLTSVACSVGSLVSVGYGDNTTATVTIVARAAAAGSYVNVASVGADNPDSNVGGNNYAAAVVSVA